MIFMVIKLDRDSENDISSEMWVLSNCIKMQLDRFKIQTNYIYMLLMLKPRKDPEIFKPC